MEQVFLYLAALIAYIIKGIAGFGNTLIMTPLFSFFMDNKTISPIDLLYSIPINIFIVLNNRKSFDWKIVLPLSILVLAGDIPGALLLKTGDVSLLKLFLSVLIIGLAIEMWTRPQNVKDKKPNRLFLAVIGLVSGITTGLFGISVLLVAYVSRTTTERGAFRANLCFVFLIDEIFRVFYYSLPSVHLLTGHAFLTALKYSPSVIIGVAIGSFLSGWLKERTVKKVVVVLLIASGVTLFIKNI